jgi:hypothetical protein
LRIEEPITPGKTKKQESCGAFSVPVEPFKYRARELQIEKLGMKIHSA